MNDLESVRDQIVKLHEGIQSSMRRSVVDAIEIGRLLENEKKTRLGFVKWIEEELPFSRRTADNYRNLYHNQTVVANVTNLVEAYKLIEDTQKAEQRAKQAKDAEMIRLRLKTGVKPADWDDSLDVEYARAEKNKFDDEAYRKRSDEYWEKRRQEEARLDKEREERARAAAEPYQKVIDEIVEHIEKKLNFKERFRVSNEGQKDPFIDALIDHLESLEDDNRRIETCHNIIKVCKGIVNDLHSGGGHD